jgi:predicted lactoylglutathione lyase
MAGIIQRESVMSRQIFLNLPVADLARSVAFFEALGFTRKPEFSDDTGAGLVISDTIWLMLTTHARFKTFTPKEVCDTSRAVEVLISLSCDSKAEVDALVAKALAAGGSTYDQPEDLGFMYSHSFVDLDGHGWGSCTCRARRREPNQCTLQPEAQRLGRGPMVRPPPERSPLLAMPARRNRHHGARNMRRDGPAGTCWAGETTARRHPLGDRAPGPGRTNLVELPGAAWPLPMARANRGPLPRTRRRS